MIKPVLDNMDEAEKYLKEDEEAKDIEWTTVLPPGLDNKPVTSEYSKQVF